VYSLFLLVVGLNTVLAEPGFVPMNPPAAFKPSDIFFNPPPEQNRGYATPNNNKGADFIVARDIEIRGWLIGPGSDPEGAFVLINGSCQKRIEDFHYDIVPDLEWMLDPAQNPTLIGLVGASFPGHGAVRDYVICPEFDPFTPDCIKCNHGTTTQRLPFEDLVPNSVNPNNIFVPGDAPCFDRFGLTGTCLPLGITPNSFILPGNRNLDNQSEIHTPRIIVELNAYWSDVRSDLSQSVLNAAFAAPTDTRVFWPFNPANPDGTGGDLERGDYVRIRGTLWQDGSHSESAPGLACWEGGSLRGHGGWTEIHPVDLIERNPSRKLSEEEMDDLLNGTETAPQKLAIPKTRFSVLAVCAPVEPLDAVRAEDLRIVPTISRPSPACRLRVKEWIDGRLTDLRNVDQHSVTLVDTLADPHVDVHISLHSSGSLSGHGREGRFKAIYEVWWDCPPNISCPANVTVAADPGRSAASVIYSVTATDERSGVQVSCSPPNGSVFPVGVTFVHCTATDASGNQSTCSFPLEVLANPIQGNGTGLLGVYYDNVDFTAPRVARTEAVNFDWVLGAPAPGVDVDTFSVRWTGKIVPRYTDVYRIFTVSDDGVRLWIDGQQLVNDWNDHAPTERYGDIFLEAGLAYDVVMEMYENGGGASAKLLWQSGRQPKEPIPASQLLPARLECPTPNRPTFSANFVNGMPAATAIFGQAVVNDGWLKLTRPDTAFGIFYIDNFSGTQPVYGFEAKFTAALFGSTCCGGAPADGFSFNLVPAASVRSNPGYGQPGEEGLDEGLAVNFDTWDNGGGEGPAVEVKWRGQVIARQPFQASQSALGITAARQAALEVIINLTSDGLLTVSYGVIRVLDSVQTPYTPFVIGTPKWVIGARNGGANDNHWIRDLQIVVNRAKIPELFNTGVDVLGRPLTDNAIDPHYLFSVVGGQPMVSFIATAAGGFPIGPWLPDNTASAWISPTTSTLAPQDFDILYDTAFNLKGLNTAGAVIHGWVAADNQLVDIRLNGQSTGQATALGGEPFTRWQAFAITSGILPGANTLTFVTRNGTGGDNPTGLRVEMCGWATPPPLLKMNIAYNSRGTIIGWGSLPHKQYFLEHTDKLSGPWVREPTGGIFPGAYQAQFTDLTFHGGRDPIRFYRVIEAP
jgi:PA14 domain/HYR domain